MFRVLHLADLHLGWGPTYTEEPRRAEPRLRREDLLRRAEGFALNRSNSIGMAVIVAELFESHRPDTTLVGAVLENLCRLKQTAIRGVTVPGNHDETPSPVAQALAVPETSVACRTTPC